ncbi:aspartyl/asparaginyl beta-hydroxylase domain-containing protein [Elongatibacter sediminis]|uniref:Aspartyl/asparaginyl beta-hydroxylase domain-containing protein n=1 Tax=Elongatibacter sediminis TaxID=3119006 RepID=A0AAW9RKE6_9GAMM
MKLPREFIRLPLTFDAERMAAEVADLPAQAWQAHPLNYSGNSAVPLVSVNGEANDFFAGPMAETPWLKRSPYLRQMLASFGVVFGRSRLMGLAGGSEVPLHCDINYHWFSRVRIHVPIVTWPDVRFHCHDQAIHMAAGEAWIFDNWKVHRVVNPTSGLRVHLVADTLGSSSFWNLVDDVLAADQPGSEAPAMRQVPFDDSSLPELLLEQVNTPDVMHPSEANNLTEDLIRDLEASGDQNPPIQVRSFVRAVRAFCQDWTALWARFGDAREAWPQYEQRRDALLRELVAMRKPLVLASNERVAQKVMLSRVLVACVHRPLPGMNEIQFGG